jgi:hypothetical protein
MHGFKRIDALDPSRGMLEVAKKKELYRCYTCSYLKNGVLTNRNDKKTNYCNFIRHNVVPLLCEKSFFSYNLYISQSQISHKKWFRSNEVVLSK